MLFAEDRLVSKTNKAHIESHSRLRPLIQGPERVKGLYAFRSIIDNGARIAFGSDFPVEDINPISGFYAAVTRLSPQGDSPHGPGGW
jgi:predicted amidohydrolase YtcJ